MADARRSKVGATTSEEASPLDRAIGEALKTVHTLSAEMGVPFHAALDRLRVALESAPDKSRKAYATVPLSFHPHGRGYRFEFGDELQDILPAEVVRICLARSDASYDKPKAR